MNPESHVAKRRTLSFWQVSMTALCGLMVCSLTLMSPIQAWGQGVLIIESDRPVPLPRPFPHRRPRPEPTPNYSIKEFSIDAKVEDQIAQTQVTQVFVNNGSRQIEAAFVFPLPYDGAIDRLTFMVDGKEYEAELMAAEKARGIYEGYIRKNQDPALLEWMGRGLFRTSVFPIPAGAERKVTLRYSQVLRKDRNLTDYVFPLSTGQYSAKPIETLSFNVSLNSAGKLKSIYSPSHAVDIKRDGDHRAKVSFSANNAIPISDFRLYFDTSDKQVGASLLSYWPAGEEQGYFALLASPEIENRQVELVRKTVVLVVDRSGSMSGKKIDQAKEALRFVVNNLREGDLFNIVAYDSQVEVFKEELQKYNQESRVAALGFVENLFAGGSTNIDGALQTALKMVQSDDTPNYVVFLTDGLPTHGETNEMKIVENSKEVNDHNARVINFGVGYDVNSRLLDRLTVAHRGQSEYVRPDDDLEVHVSRLYSKISSPVMTGIELDFEFDEAVALESGKPVNRMYPNPMPDLFQGEQLVLVGRYRKDGAAKIRLSGSVGDKQETLEFGAEFRSKSSTANYAFVEKLWAVRRVGEIIDQLDLNGQNDELVKELISLSIKHGILTQYTSFLADDQADSGIADGRRSMRAANANLMDLARESGESGFAQREVKNFLKQSSQTNDAFGGAGGGGSGGFGGRVALPSASTGPSIVAGRLSTTDSESKVDSVASNVAIAGNAALFKRGDRWIAANAKDFDPEKDLERATTIERFSDEYFKLIAENTAEENAILSQQQPETELVVQLRGQYYVIK